MILESTKIFEHHTETLLIFFLIIHRKINIIQTTTHAKQIHQNKKTMGTGH